jgi:hypothetical protein
MVVASPQQTVSTAKILPTSIKLAPISAQMIAEVGTTETQVMENVPLSYYLYNNKCHSDCPLTTAGHGQYEITNNLTCA